MYDAYFRSEYQLDNQDTIYVSMQIKTMNGGADLHEMLAQQHRDRRKLCFQRGQGDRV